MSDLSGDTTASAGAAQPAIDGWFTLGGPNPGDGPRLIGSKCAGCGTYAFPPRSGACPNPSCVSDTLEPVELSATGTLWSFAENHYAPPAPYVAAEPFVPYALAAVELEREGMVVLGQAAKGVRAADLRVGMPMTLAIDVLFTGDDGVDRLIWLWEPVEEEGTDVG